MGSLQNKFQSAAAAAFLIARACIEVPPSDSPPVRTVQPSIRGPATAGLICLIRDNASFTAEGCRWSQRSQG